MRLLKKLRQEQGLTQAALAEIIGVTPDTISRYETRVPDASIVTPTLQKIAGVLGYEGELGDLLKGTEAHKHKVNPNTPTMSREEFDSKQADKIVCTEYYCGRRYTLEHMAFGPKTEYMVKYRKRRSGDADYHYLGAYSNDEQAIKALHEFQEHHRNNDEPKVRIKKREDIAEALAGALADWYTDMNIQYQDTHDTRYDLVHAMRLVLIEETQDRQYPATAVIMIQRAAAKRNIKMGTWQLRRIALDFARDLVGE